MMQLFDDCGCKSCSLDDKQHLENMHDEGYNKLIQILDTNQKLCLTNLSVEQLSSQMYHKAMCEILEGFFREVDYMLPDPSEMTDSAKASRNLPKTAADMIKPAEESSMIMASSNMIINTSKTSTLNKTVKAISPSRLSSAVVVANDVHKSVQDGTSNTATSNDSTIQDPNITSSSESPKSLPKIASGSPKITADSPMPTEDTSDSTDDVKRIPVLSKRLVPLVTKMKCQRNLIRPNGKFDGGTIQPKIKTVRIVLSSLTKEKYMELATNKTGKASTSPVQQKEPPQNESANSLPGSLLTSSISSVVHCSSDEDNEPPSDLHKTDMVTHTRRKRKVASTSFLKDRRNQRDLQSQEQSQTPESENSGTVTCIKRKRKSVPPVKYVSFGRIKSH